MTKPESEQAAREYVLKHVKYASENGRLDNHLELYRNNPEMYPEAETCDGCDRDSIAVFQSHEAGQAHGEKRGYLRALEDVQKMLAETYEFEDGHIDTYADEIYVAIDKLKEQA